MQGTPTRSLSSRASTIPYAECARGAGGAVSKFWVCCAGERALETLREMDAAAVRCFRPAARKLLQELGDPEKALAMALARVTGFTAVKVGFSQRTVCGFPLVRPVQHVAASGALRHGFWPDGKDMLCIWLDVRLHA